MSIRRRALNTTGVVLLALAVFYSSRFWPDRMPLLPEAAEAEPDTRPDYSITAFHAVDLDETGQLRYELAADALVHYPVPERAELDAPELVFYRRQPAGDDTVDTQPWQVTAARGTVTDNGDRLDLSGEVRAVRLVDAEDTMLMETDRITIFGRQERAVTDAPVKLSSALASLTGVGMQVDLARGQMHLLSQVRGHYDPP